MIIAALPPLNNLNFSNLFKYRRVCKLHKSHSSNELLFASKVSLNKESKTEKVKSINKIYLDKNVESSMLSGNEALSLMLESNMTKAAFQLHRNAATAKQCNLYPAYNNIKYKLFCATLTT